MGKGSKRRPTDKRYCNENKLENEWNRIFKKKGDNKKDESNGTRHRTK